MSEGLVPIVPLTHIILLSHKVTTLLLYLYVVISTYMIQFIFSDTRRYLLRMLSTIIWFHINTLITLSRLIESHKNGCRVTDINSISVDRIQILDMLFKIIPVSQISNKVNRKDWYSSCPLN